MKFQVSTLERLSNSLSFLQTASAQEGDGQVESRLAPASILQADWHQVVKASDAAQVEFNDKARKVVELIDIERKKLQDLEAALQELQPAISNKLQQVLEINRTLGAASRGMERDADLLAIGKDKCSLIEDALAAQRKSRSQATNDVLMASKLLQHVDTAIFLARDVQALKMSPTQPGAASSHGFLDGFSPYTSSHLSLLQVDVGDALLEESDDGANGDDSTEDKVIQMIHGLIASLRAQANSEVNQQQFCQDSLSQNRQHRVAKTLSIDIMSSTVRWAKIAIVRLADDLKYFEAEMEHLAQFQKSNSKALSMETTRVNNESSHLRLANEVIEKTVVILNQLCNLDDEAASLAQHGNDESRPAARHPTLLLRMGSRFSQCKQASELLKSASHEVKALDDMTMHYLEEYKDLSNNIDNFAQSGQDEKMSEERAGLAARAQRASELATAQKDMREAGKELKLIDDAQHELEHSCSHVETREDRMARRKEQIDALKEASKVLEGEAIPV